VIHEVKGRNLREALERARDQVGRQAMVVTHRTASDGGVTIAVTQTPPTDPMALERLRSEAKALLGSKQRQSSLPGAAAVDAERGMLKAGASDGLILRVCDQVEAKLSTGHHPLDLAAGEIGSIFPVARAKKNEGHTRFLSFLGQTGVGKTSTLGKLALRLTRSGRRVALACVDGTCAPGLERIATQLNIPLFAGQQMEDLVHSLRGGTCYDAVLLDTPGDLTRDVLHAKQLAAGLERAQINADVDSYLVISALASRAALQSATDQVRALRPAGCVITKLDETEAPAPVLEHALASQLPIAFLCNGPRLIHDFYRPTPDRFADLILRGRIVR
jgi:flagellar biosynthesis protein FlhF